MQDFEAWYLAQYPQVISLLVVVAGDLDVAAEAAADTFARAHEQWGRVQADDTPVRWLHATALDAVERRERWQALAERLRRGAPPQLAESLVLAPEVWRALRALTPSQRTVIALRYVLDLPEAEVTRVMSVTRAEASADLVAARRALIGLLAAEETDGIPAVEVDIGAALQPVRDHPWLPRPPSLEEIVAGAQRRRLRRRGLALTLAVVAVVALAGIGAVVGNGSGGDDLADAGTTRDEPSAATSSLPSTTASTRPATTTTRPPPSPTTTEAPTTSTRVASAAPTTSPAAPVAVAAPRVTPVKSSTIEDMSIGTGAGTVRYSGGSWTRCGGCDIATGDSSYYYGYVAGQSYAVTFRGVQLKVYAPSDKAGGVARVTVDGRPAATPTVSFLTSGTPANGLRWDSGVLADGTHTVVLTIEAGSDEVVLFDHADVYTAG